MCVIFLIDIIRAVFLAIVIFINTLNIMNIKNNIYLRIIPSGELGVQSRSEKYRFPKMN